MMSQTPKTFSDSVKKTKNINFQHDKSILGESKQEEPVKLWNSIEAGTLTSVALTVSRAHDRPRRLSCFEQLRSFVLHASIATPNRRRLGRQQIVRRLGHPSANSVEPFLTRGLAQNGLLVIVHFAQAYAAWVDRLGRGGRAPSVHNFIIAQSAVTAARSRRLLQGFVVGVKDAVEFLRSALCLQLWRAVLSLLFFTVMVLHGGFVHSFARVLFRRWRNGPHEVILLLRKIRAQIPGLISLWTENPTSWTSALPQILKTDVLSWIRSEVHDVIAAAAKRLPVIWVFRVAVVKSRCPVVSHGILGKSMRLVSHLVGSPEWRRHPG